MRVYGGVGDTPMHPGHEVIAVEFENTYHPAAGNCMRGPPTSVETRESPWDSSMVRLLAEHPSRPFDKHSYMKRVLAS